MAEEYREAVLLKDWIGRRTAFPVIGAKCLGEIQARAHPYQAIVWTAAEEKYFRGFWCDSGMMAPDQNG